MKCTAVFPYTPNAKVLGYKDSLEMCIQYLRSNCFETMYCGQMKQKSCFCLKKAGLHVHHREVWSWRHHEMALIHFKQY